MLRIDYVWGMNSKRLRNVQLFYLVVSSLYVLVLSFQLFFKEKLMALVGTDVNARGVVDVSLYQKETLINNISFGIQFSIIIVHIILSLLLIGYWKRITVSKVLIIVLLLVDFILVLLSVISGVFSNM